MEFIKRNRWIVGLVTLVVLASAGGVAVVAATPGDPGQLQEGANLLDRAAISVEEAIAAARKVATGEVQEVELEVENGTLIFEVEIGDKEVIVDATTGVALGTEVEDGSNESEREDDDGPSESERADDD